MDVNLSPKTLKYSCGLLSLKTLHTHGHSKGGLTYLVEGLSQSVAGIVGDAVFAGSMGGGMISYQNALRTNKEKIMSLPRNYTMSWSWPID